jgi:hypothetical protein
MHSFFFFLREEVGLLGSPPLHTVLSTSLIAAARATDVQSQTCKRYEKDSASLTFVATTEFRVDKVRALGTGSPNKK